jgi:ketosteroid isomerase-like protein
MFARDALLRFPGDHALGGEYRGRDAIAAWFDKGWSMFDFDFTVEDVAVAGPPWNMRIATRWRNDLRTKDGQAFPNRGMQYIRLRFGRVIEDELYEDTQNLARAIATAERPTAGTSAPAPAP